MSSSQVERTGKKRAQKKPSEPQAGKKQKREGWIDWMNSEPKKILLSDLMNGYLSVDPVEMPPEVAWELCYRHIAEFAPVVYTQFEARLKDHRKQVQAGMLRSDLEAEALAHDRTLFPRPLVNNHGELVFDLHPAKLLLRADMEKGRHKNMTPQNFWKTRPEYQVFKEPTFRQRIYQESRRRKFVNWLNQERAKKDRKCTTNISPRTAA